VAHEERQYYFTCSSCPWFGPLTNDELASIRVYELGSSRCPRCGQAGYLDPVLVPRSQPHVTWIAVAAMVAIAALVTVLS